jgi:hypothetical protein
LYINSFLFNWAVGSSPTVFCSKKNKHAKQFVCQSVFHFANRSRTLNVAVCL